MEPLKQVAIQLLNQAQELGEIQSAIDKLCQHPIDSDVSAIYERIIKFQSTLEKIKISSSPMIQTQYRHLQKESLSALQKLSLKIPACL